MNDLDHPHRAQVKSSTYLRIQAQLLLASLLGAAHPLAAAADLCDFVAKQAPTVLRVPVTKPSKEGGPQFCTVKEAGANSDSPNVDSRTSLTARLMPNGANVVMLMRQHQSLTSEQKAADEPSLGKGAFSVRGRYDIQFHFVVGSTYRMADGVFDAGITDADVARTRAFAQALAKQ